MLIENLIKKLSISFKFTDKIENKKRGVFP